MKKFFLLRLEHNANYVLLEKEYRDKTHAIMDFNNLLHSTYRNVKLDEDGYCKPEGSNITFCVGETFSA